MIMLRVALAWLLLCVAAMAQVGQIPAWPPTKVVSGGGGGITRVQGTGDATHAAVVNYNGTNTTTCVITFPATVGSGDTVVGGLGGTLTVVPTSVVVADDKGNTYNLETAAVVAGAAYANAFSLSNIANAPSIITVTINATGVPFGSGNCIADEFHGTATASTDQRDGTAHGGQPQSSPGTGANGVTSGSFTTVTNNDLLYNFTVNNNVFGNATLTAGTTTNASYAAATTSSFAAFSSVQLNSAWATQSTAGASSAGTWTQSQNDARETYMIAIK